MLKTIAAELIASAIVILATLALVVLLSRVTAWAKRSLSVSQKKPECRIRIYYQSGCECFEMCLERFLRSSALQGFDTRLTVVDCVCSPESGRWLEELRKKHDYCFEIITKGGGSNGDKPTGDKNCRGG